ncbi:MAG: GPW/gp25 family protein [Flavobacteriales bacterium]|nr:GPW/gp25 family protein [Flavobacteriales bacterium]
MINNDSIEADDFLGTGWAFPVEFTKGIDQVEMVSDEIDIEQSLVILLSTQVGERVTQLDYGTIITDYTFEKLDVQAATLLEDDVKTAITYYEPRVTVSEITSEVDINSGKIEMDIQFTVNQTNTRHNIVFPFYFNEGTNIL